MDTQREIRTSTRNRGFGSVQSAASATAMEVKRKKILQSILFQQTQVWAYVGIRVCGYIHAVCLLTNKTIQ